MDVFYAYTYGTAGWLSLQALPLLLAPNVVFTFLTPEARKSSGRLLNPSNSSFIMLQMDIMFMRLMIVDLEVYFSRSLALALFLIAFLTILLSGSIPLTSSLADCMPPNLLVWVEIVPANSLLAKVSNYKYPKLTLN